MKNLFIIIITFLFAIPVHAQFRDTKWGMSTSEVKRVETAKLVSEDKNSLSYKLELGDAKAMLNYNFNNGKLIEILYTFTAPSGTDLWEKAKQIENIWKSTIENLTQKYGEPLNNHGEEYFHWSLDNFAIRAYFDRDVKVSYTPPIKNQKDIL